MSRSSPCAATSSGVVPSGSAALTSAFARNSARTAVRSPDRIASTRRIPSPVNETVMAISTARDASLVRRAGARRTMFPPREETRVVPISGKQLVDATVAVAEAVEAAAVLARYREPEIADRRARRQLDVAMTLADRATDG